MCESLYRKTVDVRQHGNMNNYDITLIYGIMANIQHKKKNMIFKVNWNYLLSGWSTYFCNVQKAYYQSNMPTDKTTDAVQALT